MIGRRLGTYEITAKLGEGGMGEVWRATDTKLRRDVAVKILPPAFVADTERLARFEREAQLLAQLNHPNIAQIYGMETSGEAHALVMELVDGPTLAERLAQGALPLEESLAIARQIAEALEEAHEKGIVHRDLKPQNIKAPREGKVKVLDFGLAKAMEPAGAPPLSTSADFARSPTLMHSPTLTAIRGTELGVILGTAAYMSPEQARGLAVDRRADIWAFGVVLFEMLTGRSLFAGETVSDTLAGVLKTDVDWSALPVSVPPPVRQLLRRCLERNAKSRLRDIGDARLALEEAMAGRADETGPAPVAEPSRAPARWPWLLAASAAVALATFGLTRWLAPAAPAGGAKTAHVSIALPPGYELGSSQLTPIAISHDGSRIAFVGLKDGRNRIFVRALDEPEAKPLEGTEGGDGPFFSPDGQWIGFFADGKLRKVTVNGAAVETLADVTSHRGGDWGDDGFLYFAPTNVGGIWRVPERGGAAAQYTRLEATAGEISHRWPHRVAGSDALLFSVWTGPGDDEHSIALQSEAAGAHRLLVKGGNAPQYVPRLGKLFYTRRGQLLSVDWRPSRADLGRAVPVAAREQPRDGVGNEGCGNFSVSDDGTLAYLFGGGTQNDQRLVWIDRSGVAAALPLPQRAYENVAVSPDGARAVVQIREAFTRLWVYEFSRGTLTPVGPASASSQAALWSADGSRLIFRGTRKGTRNLYWMPADGSAAEERLTTKSGVIQTPTSASSDGRILLFNEHGPGEPDGSGIWWLALDGDRTPKRLFPHPQDGANGQLSPDGRWVAYEARVSSRREIFVAPFSGAGERRLVSADGGTEPLWSRDGRELFFQSGNRLMSVTVSPGATFSATLPRVEHEGLFLRTITSNTSFGIVPDGKRFLRIQPVDQQPTILRIDLVLDWFSEVARR